MPNPLATIPRPAKARPVVSFRPTIEAADQIAQMARARGTTVTAIVEGAVADLYKRWRASQNRRA